MVRGDSRAMILLGWKIRRLTEDKKYEVSFVVFDELYEAARSCGPWRNGKIWLNRAKVFP
jgi:hypothetical protein